jgi:hypothetical protein
MARQSKRKINPQVETLRPYLEGVAKKLADDLFGPQGPKWGTSLTELEDIALEARAILSEKLVELSLDRQAMTAPQDRPAAMQACPTCQRPFGEARDCVPRLLATRAGEVDWQEPEEYCPRCRRAFFPSEQKSGH